MIDPQEPADRGIDPSSPPSDSAATQAAMSRTPPDFAIAPAAAPVISGEPVYQFENLSAHVRSLLAGGTPDIYRRVIQEVDRHILFEAMRHFRGNQLQAAERLGLSRMTLRSKLRSFGLLSAGRKGQSDVSRPDSNS